MAKLTKEEGVEILADAQKALASAKTKEETLTVLQEAGSAVGYSPAFRCLVIGKEPADSIRWG